MISPQLPNVDDEPDLFEQVKTYQLHKDSKTCRKYKNKACRFQFRKFFTEKTIIGKRLARNVTEAEKNGILAW